MAMKTQTLAATVWPRLEGSLARQLALALIGTALLWASAKVQVPFWPVPMTMQTFVVLSLGAAYGSRLGTATVALYLLEGALGLPVFAGTPERGIGLAYMAGPTGGYLAGFVAAAWLVGMLAERGWDRSVLLLGAAMLLGHIIIFACGFSWLATFMGAEKAWLTGVAPFHAGTALKTVLAALLIWATRLTIANRR
ncbi:MAG: biotin transporter BioY [Hyphomicrobiaceae bacterium]|nr:MAG: biotin transporter BioY [Hyphomicrobiaceae bacterium]